MTQKERRKGLRWHRRQSNEQAPRTSGEACLFPTPHAGPSAQAARGRESVLVPQGGSWGAGTQDGVFPSGRFSPLRLCDIKK